jgi:hypothetical protein
MSLPREIPERIEDRLIVALDVPSVGEARAIIDTLDGVVSFFKVGLWLQFAAGFDGLIAELVERGKKIFPVLSSKRHKRNTAANLTYSREIRLGRGGAGHERANLPPVACRLAPRTNLAQLDVPARSLGKIGNIVSL